MSRSVFSHRRNAPPLSQDSFNRTEGTTIATRLLSTDGTGILDPLTWTKGYSGTEPGGLGITTNQIVNHGNDISTPNGQHTAYLDLLRADVDIRIDVTVNNVGGQSAGLLARYSDDNNFWSIQWGATGPQIDAYKTVSGTESLVASSSTLGGLTGTLRVVMVGSSWTVYTPVGTSVLTFTDSFNSTATKHGIALRNSPAVLLNQSTMDNWRADAIGG